MEIAIEVRTPRLSIRAMKEEDAKDVLEILSDKETAELGGMNPISSLDAALDYLRFPSGHLVSIVKEGKEEEVIGIMEVYPKYLFIELDAPEYSYCLGYYIKKSQRVKGYMTEAVKAVKEELFRQGVSQVTIEVFPSNEASKRVASKCGFKLDGLYKDFLELGNERMEDVEFYSVDNPYQLASQYYATTENNPLRDGPDPDRRGISS